MGPLASLRSLAIALDPAGRRIRAELRRIAATIKPADRVLDLGSGRAPYRNLFQHHRFVTADLSVGAQVRCDACCLPFATGVFDLILCTEVLEHLPHPAAALRGMAHALAPHGALVLTTPLTWGVHEARDYHRWTEMGLRQLLEATGFQIADLAARGGIFLTLGAMLQMIPWQLFGGARERRVWQTAGYVLTYTLVLIPALLLAAVDGLDHRRQFTHGYVVLCHRRDG